MKNKHSFIDDYFPKKTKTHQDTEDLGLISVSSNQGSVVYNGILEGARGWGVRRPPLHYWGPFSPMFSKKMLNLKRERPPLHYWGPFSPMFSKKMLNLKRERPPLLFLAKHHCP